MSKTEIEEMLDLPKREFIKRCKQYIDEERDGKLFEVADPGKCPLAIWVAHNDAKCHREMVPNTAACPLCGNPMCPDCGNHVVETLSRVTGICWEDLGLCDSRCWYEWMRPESYQDEKPDKAYLGNATTRELLDEIRTRIEIDGRLDYRTVDME